MKKPRLKGRVWTWQIYSTHGFVRASNITDAVCEAVRAYLGKSREKSERFAIHVKKGQFKGGL